ncbi:hypothetical protein FRC18_006548 [Serendipita sp. 400]|nr:hypothetical protein FRC18_006548 [Serendipita sp. 400]
MFEHLMKLRAERIGRFRQLLKLALCGGAAPRYIHNGQLTIPDTTYTGICTAMVELIHAIGLEPSYACCMCNWGKELDNAEYLNNIDNYKKALQERFTSLEAELPALS